MQDIHRSLRNVSNSSLCLHPGRVRVRTGNPGPDTNNQVRDFRSSNPSGGLSWGHSPKVLFYLLPAY